MAGCAPVVPNLTIKDLVPAEEAQAMDGIWKDKTNSLVVVKFEGGRAYFVGDLYNKNGQLVVRKDSVFLKNIKQSDGPATYSCNSGSSIRMSGIVSYDSKCEIKLTPGELQLHTFAENSQNAPESNNTYEIVKLDNEKLFLSSIDPKSKDKNPSPDVTPPPSQPQSAGLYQYANDTAEKEKQEEYTEKMSLVGKKYWLYRPKESHVPVIFYDSPGLSSQAIFHITETTSFKITEYLPSLGLSSCYKVFFEDGKVGYIKELEVSLNMQKCDNPLADYQLSGFYEKDILGSVCRIYGEGILEEDPELILVRVKKQHAELQKKEKREQAAWKARGGVKVGMTKKQVLKSNWGKPSSINKTTMSGLVHEQWVYDGSYLYFENGNLTAIQN